MAPVLQARSLSLAVDQSGRANIGRLHALDHRIAGQFAPIALRTTERAPSQPTRYRQFHNPHRAAVEIA